MHLSARARRDLLALLAYSVLALVLTFPLVLHFATHVAGDGSDDPALAWNLWWVPYAILNLGRSPITTDYMFYPIGLNLAYYTLTYLNAFISIPIQFTFGLIPAANLNLLLSFALSGWGTYLLVNYLLREDYPAQAHLAAFASGLLYAFSSNKFLYASLGQFNIASSQWIPFYILFLLKLFPTRTPARKPSYLHAFLLGLFLLFQALSEFIFASFLVLFTLVYFIYWLIVTRFQIRNLKSLTLNLLVAVLTFVIPMSPILAAMASDMLTEGDFIQQGLGFSNSFSADLLGFLVPSHLHPLWGGLEAQFHFSYLNFVYLGYSALALGVLAFVRIPRARIWAFWFALVFLITLGPTLRVNGAEYHLPFLPFNGLLEIPLIKGNRYPSRWSVLLTLCLAVMVGYGLVWLMRRAAGRRLFANGYLLTAISCSLLVFEHLAVPLPLSDLRVPEIYQTIAREPGAFAVMELPLAWRNGFRVTGSYRADSQVLPDPVFMLAQWYQTGQQHPILNGNTSRNPELKFQYFGETPVLDSIIAIQEGYSIDEATRARDKQLTPRLLQFFNIRYVIWHTPSKAENREVADKTRAYVQDIFPMEKIAETYENGRGLVVYRVDDLPSVDALTLKPDDPLARLYLGEGWGAVGGSSLLAVRPESKLFLPLSAPRNLKLTLSHPRISQAEDLGARLEVNQAGYSNPQLLNGDYVFEVPARFLHAGINELTFRFARSLSAIHSEADTFPIGQTGASSPAAIVIRSAGEEQGSFGHIYVNGVEQSPNARGYNLVVINPRSGQVEARANFDTFAGESESARLAEFVEQIPDGKIVAAAACDEASFHLTPEAVNALELLGAQEDLRGKFRWSHALIGVKGAPGGSALEAASETRVSQLILGAGATEPNVWAQIGEIRVETQE